jgi:endo-beta-N-acetylglucosaminidase D
MTTQELFVPPEQNNTGQNDNITSGMPIYGQVFYPKNNLDATNEPIAKLQDIDRVQDSCYYPYFSKMVDPSTALPGYDWAINYVANVKNKAHTGMFPSLNKLDGKQRYN